MGVYWKWVCRKRREHLDPEWFGEGDKHPAHNARTNAALVLLCQWGVWQHESVELLSDCSDEDFYGDHNEPSGWSDAVKDEAVRFVEEHIDGVPRTFPA